MTLGRQRAAAAASAQVQPPAACQAPPPTAPTATPSTRPTMRPMAAARVQQVQVGMGAAGQGGIKVGTRNGRGTERGRGRHRAPGQQGVRVWELHHGASLVPALQMPVVVVGTRCMLTGGSPITLSVWRMISPAWVCSTSVALGVTATAHGATHTGRILGPPAGPMPPHTTVTHMGVRAAGRVQAGGMPGGVAAAQTQAQPLWVVVVGMRRTGSRVAPLLGRSARGGRVGVLLLVACAAAADFSCDVQRARCCDWKMLSLHSAGLHCHTLTCAPHSHLHIVCPLVWGPFPVS